MSKQSIVVFRMPEPAVVAVSTPVRVDEWYGEANHLNTISIKSSNFKGRFILEASICNDPTEDDWFAIKLGDYYYVDYPRYNPNGDSSLLSFNFKGRFVWMRGRQDKSQYVPSNATDDTLGTYGFIDRVLLNI